MSGARLMKGKYGSICERKNERLSSAWGEGGSDGEGGYRDGENKSVLSCARGDGSVEGVGTPPVLWLMLMEFARVPFEPDEADNGILSSLRSRSASVDDPDALASDCIADNMISNLLSSWAIRVSDAGASVL